MNFQHDHEHMQDILEAAQSAALQFLESLPTRPVSNTPQPPPHDVLPNEGIGAMQAISLFRAKYEAQLSASPGPATLAL